MYRKYDICHIEDSYNTISPWEYIINRPNRLNRAWILIPLIGGWLQSEFGVVAHSPAVGLPGPVQRSVAQQTFGPSTVIGARGARQEQLVTVGRHRDMDHRGQDVHEKLQHQPKIVHQPEGNCDGE